MKICLVTTFPPSTGGLSEYGFHIAQELHRNPFLNLTVLADELPPNHVELDGFKVLRCWSFDDPGSSYRLLRTLQQIKPDVVWFNLLFSTFGRNPLVAFTGLMTPLMSRLSGRYTHVTLHHLMDTVELKDAGVSHEGLYRLAGAMATRMLLLSNSVSVLMPGYRKILNDKYGRDNVHLRAHGILARRPEFPDFSRRESPRILAFGKWGTYKRLELMIEAFDLLTDRMPDAKLIIAGGDHPQAHGYTHLMQQLCADKPQVEFRGYVPENELADLFQSSSVAVMPYSSSTGCSGVAHLACAYGVPIVCSDLADFRQMAQGEELAIEFYPPGDAQGLADCLLNLLQDQEKLQLMATRNFSAGLRMTMPNVVQKYLRHFEVQQRVQTLKYVSRIRRLPHWLPSKSLLLRFMTRNSLSWAKRSAVLQTHGNARFDPRLFQGDGDGRRQLNGTASAGYGDAVGVGNGTGTAVGGVPGAYAARTGSHQHDSDHNGTENGDTPLALEFADQSHPEETEAEPFEGEKVVPFLAAVPRNGNGSNGQDGSTAPAARRNGTGRK